MCGGIIRDVVASLEPSVTGLAQFWFAQRTGVAGQPGQIAGDGVFNELRRGVARLAHGEANWLVSRVRRDARMQHAKPLKRVGLQFRKQGIYNRIVSLEKTRRSRDRFRAVKRV